jgi:hypothetical protein
LSDKRSCHNVKPKEGKKMTKTTYRQANRRYHKLFFPAMILYAVTLVGGRLWVGSSGVDNLAVRTVAGLAAGIPLMIAIWALLRFVRETDEFNRQINQQSLAFAGGVTAGLAALIGFLQMYDVVVLFPAFWFVVVYFVAYGLGQAFGRKAAIQCGPDEG